MKFIDTMISLRRESAVEGLKKNTSSDRFRFCFAKLPPYWTCATNCLCVVLAGNIREPNGSGSSCEQTPKMARN